LIANLLRVGSLNDQIFAELKDSGKSQLYSSVIINWLISPVVWIGQNVGPELGHLAVVAIFAGVCEKDAPSIVLGRLWLARST
jgi:hypothetical protein